MKILNFLPMMMLCLAGCSDNKDPDSNSDPQGLECEPGRLASDFRMAGPLAGPGVGEDGKLVAGTYVVGATYLRLKPDVAAQQKFNEVVGPISLALMSQPGLVALQIGSSDECGTARTFSVWESEEAMYNFVGGGPHGAAVGAIGQVSRGGSIVTHWETGPEGATWEEALKRLAAVEGLGY